MSSPTSSREWLRRLGWLLALWCGGVLAVGGFAMLLRLLMTAAGMRGVG
jgi:hypothetical protein